MSYTHPIPEPDLTDEIGGTGISGLHPDDTDDEWAVAAPRGFRVRAVTASLLALVVLAGGFWGGVLAEKHHGTGSSASNSSLSQLRAAARSGLFTGRGGTGTGGTGLGTGGGGPGLAGAATTGTVVGVQGDTLYVSDTNGNLVKVTVGPAATVTRTGSASLASLKPGDTVVVSGSTGANGTVNATAVRASEKA